MNIVYLAHPVSGNIKGNMKKILDIVRFINMNMEDVTPFAPYVVDLMALDDNIPEQRLRGIKNNVTYFVRGVFDELWICGDVISSGMQAEIILAEVLGIPVVKKSYKELEKHEQNNIA